jgi:hypothetical protein
MYINGLFLQNELPTGSSRFTLCNFGFCPPPFTPGRAK